MVKFRPFVARNLLIILNRQTDTHMNTPRSDSLHIDDKLSLLELLEVALRNTTFSFYSGEELLYRVCNGLNLKRRRRRRRRKRRRRWGSRK